MTMLEAPAYVDVDVDVVEAEVIDVDDDAILDTQRVVEAIVVDALALDVDAIEADAIEADVIDAIDAVEADVVDVEAIADTQPQPEAEPDGTARRHLRVAPDLVGRRRRVRIAAAGAAVAISATLFAVVGFNVELAQHQIELQKLQTNLQAEQRHYYDLRKEVAERSAPPAIVGEAQRLGLVQATNSFIPVPIPRPPEDNAGQTPLGLIDNNKDGALGNLQP